MAGKKISELPAAGTLDGNELVEVVKGGVNSHTTAQGIADLVDAGASSFEDLTGDPYDNAALAEDLNGKADARITREAHNGSYTLLSADLTSINQGKTLIIVGNGTGDITIPPNSSVAFPVGTIIGAVGYDNAVEGSGVTITATSGSLSLPDTTSYFEKTATDAWTLHNGVADSGGWATSGTTELTGDVVIDGTGRSMILGAPAGTYLSIDDDGQVFSISGSTGSIVSDFLTIDGTLFVKINSTLNQTSLEVADDVTIELDDSDFTIKDLKEGTTENIFYYNETTGKVTYGPAPEGGGGGSWGSITGTLSDQTDLNSALNGKEPTLTSASASTAGGTITLDMNSLTQRMFVGSASFATAKTLALSNATNALVFNFHFEVTDLAATIECPSTFKMGGPQWNSSTKIWTPPAVGLFEMGGSYDGTNWKVKIVGPFE
jgi:hypothetical protein